MTPWYVYIISCDDASLYTGVTTDPHRRLREHRTGIGAKYTRARHVDGLVYLEHFADRSSALSREWAIKALSRHEKDALIAGAHNELAEHLDAEIIARDDLCADDLCS